MNKRQLNDNNDIEQGIPLVLYQGASINAVARQNEVLLPVGQSGASLASLTKVIWANILQYLSEQDIMSLRRANGQIRRCITSNLIVPGGEEKRANIVAALEPRYKKWFKQHKLKEFMDYVRFYAPEIFLAVFFIVLFSSLPIDSFQVPFYKEFVSVAENIIANGSFCMLQPNMNRIGELIALSLPEICGNYTLKRYGGPEFNNQPTTGPAFFWIACFAIAAGVYTSARTHFTYTFRNNPIEKLITGGALLVSSALSMMIPLWESLGWPQAQAVTLVCNRAYAYAMHYWNSTENPMSCPISFPRTLYNFNPLRPVAPLLAEVPTFAYQGASIVGLVALSFFAARRRAKLDQQLAFDPLNELREPVVRSLPEKPEETTRLIHQM